MPMLNGRATCLAAFPLACGCLLTLAMSSAPAQGKKAAGTQEVLLSKSDKLTADDPIDNGKETSRSHRKVYKITLSEGQAYRIDLSSKDFDAYLRLENADGKQVAFNDDAEPNKTLDSRILYLAPKTGEYGVIATSLDAGKTGSFLLEVRPASAAETVEARVQSRIYSFPDSSPAEQKKLIAEVTKDFLSRSKELTLKDAQRAYELAMLIDESNTEFARETLQSFSKILNGAGNKQLAQFGNFLQSQVKNLDRIGKEIEISGKTTGGKNFDLRDLKGKVVLVDFWATWCGPCVAEIPNIVEAHKKYHGKGFEVIGVSLDRSDDAIVKFVKARELPWQSINIEDSRKLADKYGVNAIPHPILVDREGRIASMRARGPQLHQSLERLLGKK